MNIFAYEVRGELVLLPLHFQIKNKMKSKQAIPEML